MGGAVGYVTIDHANYCNLSNPSDPNYYAFDAMGNENNLFGDIIFISGEGIGTYGMAMVAIESDPEFAQRTRTSPRPAPSTLVTGVRRPSRPARTAPPGPTVRRTTWMIRVEPVERGLRRPARAARHQVGGPLLHEFGRHLPDRRVARVRRFAHRPDGADLHRGGDLGEPLCTIVEPTVQLNFFDEDENGVSQIGPGPCPSPCSTPAPPTFNFPLETNRRPVTDFTLPAPAGAVNAGWVSMSFVNATTGTSLDQAYASYEFDGGAAFISAHIPGVQLDPSACEPLNLPGIFPVIPVIPVIPGGVLGDLDPRIGIGP